MNYKVVYTKPFNGCVRTLQQGGQKKIVQAVRAALSEAGMDGEIKSLPRTKHGESRIDDVEKYDLPDGHRLVVQLVDGKLKTRAFLYVGSHDDTQRWLDNHRNYRWITNKNDGTLEFVQVTEAKEQQYVPADRMDLDSPQELLELPLLRVLSQEEWCALGLSSGGKEVASGVTGFDYERDAEGIIDRITKLEGWDKAAPVLDLLAHAKSGEWPQLHERIRLLNAESAITKPAEIAPVMLSTGNSESYVTFEDSDELANFFDKHSMADWMLFLHPEQKKVAERDFRGPARLRGVSGSGKTSVLIHRARYLAKKYHQPVLLVTLTESMRKLLDHLADDLCGVERDLILSNTMSSLARSIVHELHPKSSHYYTLLNDEQQDSILKSVVQHFRQHPDFGRTPVSTMDDQALLSFLADEISYVRGRLGPDELDQYLDTRLFQRRGRGLALNETARAAVLDCIRHYEQMLWQGGLLDYEGVVAEAVRLMDSESGVTNTPRTVLCDEVQDLSQMEVALLGRLRTPSGERMAEAENGLFLAGDGAQTIYKRGFTFRRLGIDVSSRSFTLRKNYRNTNEILTAAFGLVSEYEFADVDEEDVAKPMPPELAKRHGSRPLLLECTGLVEEASEIARRIQSLLTYGQIPGQICVVGPNQRIREEVQRALDRLGIAHTDLRSDAYYESDNIKISTIESAKGHEFSSVFIAGLVEGVLPKADLDENEISREAARLYVAMTRARDTLALTYSRTGNYKASRFLLAIQPHCDEARIRDGELCRVWSGQSEID